MTGRVHVIGAGLAGLAAALSLSSRGRSVTIHEAAGVAGGRCRSFYDRRLGCRIDNGNHLLLSANTAALDYLDEIGAGDTLEGPAEPVYPFLDLRSGLRWSLRPNPGLLPWWLLASGRRVPGSRLLDYLAALRLATASSRATVAEILRPGPLMDQLWRPLVVSALNAEPEQASARLMWPVLREAFGRGGGPARPLTCRTGLSESFVDPALATLAGRGVRLMLNHRLRTVRFAGNRVVGLDFEGEPTDLGEDDAVVLAVQAQHAAALLPGIETPRRHAAIVNAHFRLDRPASLPGGTRFLGLLGGTAQWVFLRDRIASITVSAADALLDEPIRVLQARLWSEIAPALGCPAAPEPPGRIIKERRATFMQSPSEAGRRPGPRTAWRNLVIAGDWTATGLPATIEGAVRSGRNAAASIG